MRHETIPSPWPRGDVFSPGRPPVAVFPHRMPESLPLHSHEFAEFVLVLAGTGVQASARGDQRIATGDLLILGPGAWHGYRRCRGLDVIDCCVGTEVLSRELGWTRRDPALSAAIAALGNDPRGDPRPGLSIVRLPRPLLGEARNALERTALACQQAEARPAAIIGALLLFVDIVARAVPAEADSAARAAMPPAVAHGLRLLEDALSHPWSLGDLASRLRIDRSYLVRRFRAAVGAPPMAYLARRRAERAAELLAGTDWPITRIAAAVGWPQPHHFAHRFRRHFAMSATAYRERAGQGAGTVPPSPRR